MADEVKTNNQEDTKEPEVQAPAEAVVEKNTTVAKVQAGSVFGAKPGSHDRGGMRRGGAGGGRRGGPRDNKNDRSEEFDQRVLDVARVTRVVAGGKRMNFRTCVAIGDKKGKVGVGLGKGADVAIAVNKAIAKAKKNMIDVAMANETIPHQIYCKLGSAKVLFKPAKKGRGVIAGGVVRAILELAGVHNVSGKILGTNNKVNNAKCTIEALRKLRKPEAKKKEVVAEKPAVEAPVKSEN